MDQDVETNMVWLDLEKAGVTRERFVELGVREGLRLFGGRVVCHYQITDEAIERLTKVMDTVLPAKQEKKLEVSNGEKREAEVVMEPEME